MPEIDLKRLRTIHPQGAWIGVNSKDRSARRSAPRGRLGTWSRAWARPRPGFRLRGHDAGNYEQLQRDRFSDEDSVAQLLYSGQV